MVQVVSHVYLPSTPSLGPPTCPNPALSLRALIPHSLRLVR